MLNLNFSEEGLELVSPPHFVYDFSRKTFLILHSIKAALFGLRQFFATESPLKMTKNAFYFTSKAQDI